MSWPSQGPGRDASAQASRLEGIPLLHEFLLVGDESQQAVASQAGVWTYGRLHQYARECAAALIRQGATDGERVLVQLHPTPEAVGVMLACSIAGAVYVPVSPDTPDCRLRQVYEQVQPVACLRTGIGEAATGPVWGEVTADGLRFRTVPRGLTRSRHRVLGTDPAYIIFTSGTTGRPKGITMSHRAAVTFLQALTQHCALTRDARVATFAPLSFDFSLLDIGLALGSGASLVQAPRLLPHHPRRLLRFLAEHRVTQVNGVPSIWRSLLSGPVRTTESLPDLHAIFFAGEAFPIALVRRLRDLFPAARLIHCYGQSESIACSFRDLPMRIPDEWEALPVAAAHEGAELMLIGPSGTEITTPDVTGELYLRGTTLFDGYWADETATRAALVPDPRHKQAPGRVLRTGDLARLTRDGEFYLAGRRDLQVQVRGNRVELEEVEKTLLGHPSVKGAVAVLVNKGTELAVCVVPSGADGIDEPDLRAYCLQRLPEYMAPRFITVVPKLPMSETGKLDRAAVTAITAREGLPNPPGQ